MPRYYFDVRDGERFFEDTEGVEFPDIEAAREEAARAVGEVPNGRAGLAKDLMPDGEHREIAIEVRGEEKQPLLRTITRFEIQRLP